MKCFCLFAIGIFGALAQTAAKPPEGSIEGQIFNATTGAPLKKATVRLVGTQPQDGSQGSAAGPNGGRGTPPRQMTRETDDQGRFQFTGLDPLRYTLSASRTGFLSQSYGARRSGWGGLPILLSQNQQIKNIALRLTPQGVITGRVLDEDGDPLPNISIKVMKLAYRSGKKQWTQAGGAQTSDIGEYRIPELEPGKYLVGTNARVSMAATEAPTDKPETIYAATYYPRSLDENSAAPIDIGPGGEMRGIDIHMIKVPAVRVRGTVTGGTGDGGRGRGAAQVGLIPRDGGAASVLRGSARMNDNGFEIRGVQPGAYLLYARLGNGATEMFTSQPLDVGSTPVNGVTLTLSPAMDLPGQVTLSERDALVDLKSVIVRMIPKIPALGGGAPNARLEAGGQFTLKGITPLRYTVSVGGLPAGCYVQAVRYGGQEITSAGAEFTARSPLEVVISPAAGKISGTVTDKDGHASIRAIVALIPSDTTVSQMQETSTDDNGAFSFDRLRPGRYKVIAWEDMEPGAYQDPEFRKPYESRGADLNVGPRDQQTTQLRVIAADEMKGR